jgi:hypothetical protein
MPSLIDLAAQCLTLFRGQASLTLARRLRIAPVASLRRSIRTLITLIAIDSAIFGGRVAARIRCLIILRV